MLHVADFLGGQRLSAVTNKQLSWTRTQKLQKYGGRGAGFRYVNIRRSLNCSAACATDVFTPPNCCHFTQPSALTFTSFLRRRLHTPPYEDILAPINYKPSVSPSQTNKYAGFFNPLRPASATKSSGRRENRGLRNFDVPFTTVVPRKRHLVGETSRTLYVENTRDWALGRRKTKARAFIATQSRATVTEKDDYGTTEVRGVRGRLMVTNSPWAAPRAAMKAATTRQSHIAPPRVLSAPAQAPNWDLHSRASLPPSSLLPHSITFSPRFYQPAFINDLLTFININVGCCVGIHTGFRLAIVWIISKVA